MTTHNKTPWIKGLTPTDLRTSKEREAPIKNMVIVNVLRAIPLMAAPNCGTPFSKYVFAIIARIKKKINQGILIFPAIGHALDMTEHQFGTWAAIAIHDRKYFCLS